MQLAQPKKSAAVSKKRASKPIPRDGLLEERAYAEIKGQILRGEYGTLMFMTERRLAAELGMSKTPIRAALERLEQEGFVTISPQQGIVVRDLSVHEIADQFEMRSALETYVVRTIAGRLTENQIERLRANLDEQQRTCTLGDTSRSIGLDMEFHILFCEFLGNQEILRVMKQLREKTGRVIARVLQISPERMNSAFAEHRTIAQAVIEGDRELAAQRVLEHLERGKVYLISPRHP